MIGAVSPPGGDISEPVSQATLRIVKVFWGLDSALAYRRHFPAINWLNSYSLYLDNMKDWYGEFVAQDFLELRQRMMTLLQEEAELEEVVKMVGMDALSDMDRLKLEAARSIREDFLHQNSFHEVDTYTSLTKQYHMMQLIMEYYEKAKEVLDKGGDIEKVLSIAVRETIGRFKYVTEQQIEEEYHKVSKELVRELSEVCKEEE